MLLHIYLSAVWIGVQFLAFNIVGLSALAYLVVSRVDRCAIVGIQ